MESETGRRFEPIEITPKMIEAGLRMFVVGDFSDDPETVAEILVAALNAGGYEVKEVGEAAAVEEVALGA